MYNLKLFWILFYVWLQFYLPSSHLKNKKKITQFRQKSYTIYNAWIKHNHVCIFYSVLYFVGWLLLSWEYMRKPKDTYLLMIKILRIAESGYLASKTQIADVSKIWEWFTTKKWRLVWTSRAAVKDCTVKKLYWKFAKFSAKHLGQSSL